MSEAIPSTLKLASFGAGTFVTTFFALILIYKLVTGGGPIAW